MADYEKRLQRLEERATIGSDRGALLMEAIRKRSDELANCRRCCPWSGQTCRNKNWRLG